MRRTKLPDRLELYINLVAYVYITFTRMELNEHSTMNMVKGGITNLGFEFHNTNTTNLSMKFIYTKDGCILLYNPLLYNSLATECMELVNDKIISTSSLNATILDIVTLLTGAYG